LTRESVTLMGFDYIRSLKLSPKFKRHLKAIMSKIMNDSK